VIFCECVVCARKMELCSVARLPGCGSRAFGSKSHCTMPDPPAAAPVVGTAPAAPPQIIIHNTGTVNIYNAPQAAANPDEVSDAEEDDEERRAALGAQVGKGIKRARPNECGYTQQQRKKMSVAERTRFDPARDTLVGLCGQCALDWRPLCEAFSPDADSEKTMRRAAQLAGAVEDYELAYADDDARRMEEALAVVLKKRTSHCRSCQDAMAKPSPNQLACKAEWERMKREACGDHGCPKPGCAEKGAASWVCMSADHVDPTTKVHQLSDYVWWSSHGGVEAMRREHEKVQWMCRCCHQLEPTSNSGRIRARGGPRDECIRAKQAYVDAYKLKLGGCQYSGCPRIVTAATVRSFDLDHRDPKTKVTHETHPDLVVKGHVGGVSGIVYNSKTSLWWVKDALDAELAGCDLLCANCHCCRKPTGRARWDAS